MRDAQRVAAAWQFNLQTFGENKRLHTRHEFDFVMKSKPFVRKWFNIYIIPNNLQNNRLGIIVSKRVSGNSVRRNFLKRIIREEFRSAIKQNDKFLDFVVQVRRYPILVEQKECRESLMHFFIQNTNRIQ